MKCYYCGNIADDVDEHIPPKSLFKGTNEWINAQAMELQLLTVPSCKLHNSETANDDASFTILIQELGMGNFYSSNLIGTVSIALHKLRKNNYELYKSTCQVLGMSEINNKGELAFDSGALTRNDRWNLLRCNALKSYRGIFYLHHGFSPRILDENIRLIWDSPEWENRNDQLLKINYEFSSEVFSKTFTSGNINVFWCGIFENNDAILCYFGNTRCFVKCKG